MCLSALRLYISLQRIFVLLHGSFDFGCQKQFVALCVADIRFCLFHARDLFQHSFQLMQIVEMAARQSLLHNGSAALFQKIQGAVRQNSCDPASIIQLSRAVRVCDLI